MAFAKNFVAFLLMTTLFGVSLGAVYEVGDSAGWSTMGNVDYNKWASSKNFHVGDKIVFNYNNQFHNVKQVSHQDFQSCNATSSIAVYTSGSDSITLKSLGHYYFLCGVPGHCEAGQKVDIMVTPVSFRPSASPNYASSPSRSSPLTPPSHATNTAPSHQCFQLSSAFVSLAIFIGACFCY
ncbi:mavicyanin-like [Pistacia vera]|uniref:mavicyanin-like n=1 Tax=Pistacia vera TaxID=55513 RepID=UPI001263B296|nr:mavicyanin-like [Pistacia vera]